MIENFLNLDKVLFYTKIIVSFSLIVSNIEYLFLINHYKTPSLFNWDIIKLKHRFFSYSIFSGFFNLFSSAKSIAFLLSLRVLLSIAILLNSHLTTLAFIFFLLFITQIIFSLRIPYGQDGSDQAQILIILTLFLLYFNPSNFTNSTIVLFISVQLTFCYIIAGFSKLSSPLWRNGDALVLIFRTNIYGNLTMYHIFSNYPTIKKYSALFIILLECSFPIIFFIPLKFSLIIILLMIIFHFITSITMGLNTFMFSFISFYPSLFYIILTINNIS